MSARRGFTLLELVVGISLSIIVVGAITGILAKVLVDNKRQRIHSELRRDAEFVNQLLLKELRQAGMGVPTGAHIDTGIGTAPRPIAFDVRRLLVAAPTSLLLIGDLPRPEVTYPVFGTLSTHPTGAGINPRNRVCWHTENNGGCCRRNGSDNCDFSDSSIFFPTNSAIDDCASGAFRRTCPWYGRLLAGDRIQIVDGAGVWTHAAVSSTTPTTGNNVVSAPLAANWNAAWSNLVSGDPPGGVLGQGFVTALDRVSYRYDAPNRRILRQHCFGDPDPNAGNWPPPGASALPASLVVNLTGAAATTCLPAETVARDVLSVAFTYFDAASVAIVSPATANAKNRIRRVEWAIALDKPSGVASMANVRYDVAGAVALQNVQVGEP